MENYVGKRLDGRYEVQEIIGVGGMAVVYKAYDSIDDRVVAVKILKDEFLANEEFRRRFKNESKAIAVLSHPNIVKVFDVSYGETLQYIVMEYIEGITLKEYIENKTISWKEAVHFITQILRALQHAHDKGIVHRDIKPQNIMLIQNGNIKVTDFGIARFSRSETRTMSENAIGSVHYISPEQARGDITDDKADIYSVGVVLYEMLTGQVPFQSDSSVSVAIMQLQAEAKRPREINDTIPEGLEQITMRAMQKNTNDRYQSAAEMLLDLEELKRNPSVRFEYNYFVDRDPTKYVGDSPIKAKPSRYEAVATESNEQEEKSRAIPAVIGVAIGLVVVAVLGLGFLALFTEVFSTERLVVPKFTDKNYYEEVKDKAEYKDFLIAVNEVQNSQYNAGVIYNQEPKAGTKVKKSEEIKLFVAVGTKMITIPNVYNLQFAQAKIALKNLGFSVTEVAEPNTTILFGTVLRTTPEQGSQAVEGSNITVYYASDENLIEVPELIGFDVESARRWLESIGLLLDENIIKENSVKPKDIIIKQNPAEKLKVTKGSRVAITISTGIPPESNTKITVKLPSRSSGVTGKIMATLNSDILFDKNVLLDGGNYSFDAVGSGGDNSIKVFVDSQLIYSCKVNFTTVPGTISDEKSYSIASYGIVPKVKDMSEDEAIKALAKAGFNNIVVEKTVTSNKKLIGKVMGQTPDYSLFTTHSLDTKVILQVGVADGKPDPESTTANITTTPED